MIMKLLESLEDINILKKGKYYYNDQPVPRVTEILSSTIHDEYLMEWANRIGLYQRKKYQDERDRAAMIGTNVHEQIEYFLKYNVKNEERLLLDNKAINSIENGLSSFMLWYNDVSGSNKIKILMQEYALSCPWFGGTFDMLMEINGKTYLVDFKTSNHISYKYFLQLAAYRYMIYNSLKINIDGCIILQLDKNTIAYEEYVLDFSLKNHNEFIEQCSITFFSLVYSYFNRIKTENMYKKLFRR